MVGGVSQRIQRVAEGARREHGEPRESRAQDLGHEQADDDAEGEVAHEVTEIGVQCERGDGPPPLAVENAARVRSPRGQPVDRQKMPALSGEEEEQNGGVEEGAFDPAKRGRGRETWPAHRRVLALEACKLVARAHRLREGDAEPDPVSVRNQVGLDPDRGEHERSLLGVGKRAEPIDLDQVRHGVIRDVIGGAWDGRDCPALKIRRVPPSASTVGRSAQSIALPVVGRAAPPLPSAGLASSWTSWPAPARCDELWLRQLEFDPTVAAIRRRVVGAVKRVMFAKGVG